MYIIDHYIKCIYFEEKKEKSEIWNCQLLSISLQKSNIMGRIYTEEQKEKHKRHNCGVKAHIFLCMQCIKYAFKGIFKPL